MQLIVTGNISLKTSRTWHKSVPGRVSAEFRTVLLVEFMVNVNVYDEEVVGQFDKRAAPCIIRGKTYSLQNPERGSAGC